MILNCPAGFWYPAGNYGEEIMKTKNTLLLAGLLFSLVACNPRVQERTSLFNGTIYLQSSDVPLIYLSGKEVLCDSFLNSSWQFRTRVFLQDNILTLIRENWRQRHTTIRHYSFPDMQLIKSDDFPLLFPSPFVGTIVIPAADSMLLYYLLELRWEREQNWFTIDLSGKMTRLDSLVLPIRARDHNPRRFASITHIGNNDFIFRRNNQIVRASITKDTTVVDTLFHIPLYPYRGELLVNPAKNRMVFAHHHHHLFHIIDLETNAVQTVDFKNGIHYYCREYRSTTKHWNPNTSYYVDAFAGKNYFYLLFWGHNANSAFGEHARRGWRRVEGGLNSAILNRHRSNQQTPYSQQSLKDIIELYANQFNRNQEFEKTDRYAQTIPNIVEQYDWNGNLVARYLLKGNPARVSGGNFWVDEQNQQFLLLAVDYQTFGCRSSFAHQLSLMVYSFCQE